MDFKAIFRRMNTPRPAELAKAKVKVQVADDPGWITGQQAPNDRPWGEVYADLEDALEAWRHNFLVRRIVNVTRAYVVGQGIHLTVDDPDVDAWVQRFWRHPRNRMDRHLGAICDALTRDGEIFPVLFTNHVDGMSYVRFKSARVIREVITNPEDYAEPWAYLESLPEGAREWPSVSAEPFFTPRLPGDNGGCFPAKPVMLHFAVNKPVEGTRGVSDLLPILPWALRYAEWMKDRVRLNRVRTRNGLLEVAVSDDSMVRRKKAQLRGRNPMQAGVYVHGPGETVRLHDLNIDANDAADDGKALRLAVATGANLSLHFLGEGEATNYATAKEMGEPTARFYTDRQQELIWMLGDLVTAAYQRYCAVTGRPIPENLDLHAITPELARADNQSLAGAAHSIAQALDIAVGNDWLDADTARMLLLKFAGETV